MTEALPKILIVDDEASVLYAFQRCLRNQFQIEVALSAEAALGLIERKGPYAVVVSDLHMPGMDGIEFLSILASMAPTTTRVALTASCKQVHREAAFTCGQVFEFLNKPCALDEMVSCLWRSVQHHEDRETARKSGPTDSRAAIPFAFEEAV